MYRENICAKGHAVFTTATYEATVVYALKEHFTVVFLTTCSVTQ
jgi:hypothetical protein